MVFCFARLRFSEHEKLRRTQPAKADKIERLTAEVSQTDMEITNVSKLIAVTKKYTHIDELTPEILNAFVDKIVVHEREKKDGKRTQAVDIYSSKKHSDKEENSEDENASKAENIEDSSKNTSESEAASNELSAGQSDTLVVYFSCTGTTKGLAEVVAKELNADLYEIVPEEPYTLEDLDYNDKQSRSTKEMNDSSSRPAISGRIENMEQYKRIILAYPIWWGEAPRILSTFVESYDFSGKTVIPFCTSGSSGIGPSADKLETLAGSGTWQKGKRFGGSESGKDVIKSLDIE